MPYVIECDRDGLLPERFDNPDDASDWLDEHEDAKVAEYAELLLDVFKAYMWTQYPTAEVYPYMVRINRAMDEASEAVDCAREYYQQSRLIRYHSWDTLTPKR